MPHNEGLILTSRCLVPFVFRFLMTKRKTFFQACITYKNLPYIVYSIHEHIPVLMHFDLFTFYSKDI